MSVSSCGLQTLEAVYWLDQQLWTGLCPDHSTSPLVCMHAKGHDSGVTAAHSLQHSNTQLRSNDLQLVLNTCMPAMCAAGLDPTWEESFEFDVADENTTKCFVKFMMGAEGEEKQIGDQCECKRLADSASISLVSWALLRLLVCVLGGGQHHLQCGWALSGGGVLVREALCL